MDGWSSKDQSMLMMRALRFNAAFVDWPPTALEKLLFNTTLRSYEKGRRIAHEVHEQSDILILVSGYLLVSRRTPDGRTHSVGIVGSGRIMSTQWDCTKAPKLELEYSAHDDAVVIHVKPKDLFEPLNATPRLWRSMIGAVLAQQREFLETLLDQNRGRAPQRLASLLVRYAELYGMSFQQNEKSETRLRMRLSQACLADLLQLSRQKINETLRAFRDAGWVRLDYNSVAILDRLALQRLAGKVHSSRIDGEPKKNRYEVIIHSG